MGSNPALFNPVELQGPFTEVLTKPQEMTTAHPAQGWVGTTGALAHLATNFIQGARDTRMRKFQETENEKARNIAIVNNYMANAMANPDLTDEARAELQQRYGQIMARQVLSIGAKGKGGGKDGGHWLGNMLRQTAEDIVGGPVPKDTTQLDMQDVTSMLSLAADPTKTWTGRRSAAMQTIQQEIARVNEEAKKQGREPWQQELMTPGVVKALTEFREAKGDPAVILAEIGKYTPRGAQYSIDRVLQDYMGHAQQPQPTPATQQVVQQATQPEDNGAAVQPFVKPVWEGGGATAVSTLPQTAPPPTTPQTTNALNPLTRIINKRIFGAEVKPVTMLNPSTNQHIELMEDGLGNYYLDGQQVNPTAAGWVRSKEYHNPAEIYSRGGRTPHGTLLRFNNVTGKPEDTGVAVADESPRVTVQRDREFETAYPLFKAFSNDVDGAYGRVTRYRSEATVAGKAIDPKTERQLELEAANLHETKYQALVSTVLPEINRQKAAGNVVEASRLMERLQGETQLLWDQAVATKVKGTPGRTDFRTWTDAFTKANKRTPEVTDVMNAIQFVDGKTGRSTLPFMPYQQIVQSVEHVKAAAQAAQR